MPTTPEFIPVPIESFSGNTRVEFDLYVRLNTKHILYIRKGDLFSPERIERIRSHAQNLWIADEDSLAYRVFFEGRLDDAYKLQSEMAPEERSSLILNSQISASESLMNSLEDENLYFSTLEKAVRFTEYLVENNSGLRPLLLKAVATPGVAAHGVGVAALAVAMAKRLGLADTKNLHLLALGCLIHDAGHLNQENSAFGKNKELFSPEESRAFLTHPTAGAIASRELVHFDQHVIKIILEHEELADGSGFPKGLTERQMHVYPLIASTANAYEHLLRFEKESFESGLQRLFIDRVGLHPLDQLNALKAIIQSF